MALTSEDLMAISGVLDGRLNSAMDLVKCEIRDLRGDMAVMEVNLRDEMKSMESNLRGEMRSMESELRSEMKNMESELRSEIGEVRTDLGSQVAELRQEVHRINLHLENVTDKKVQILAENYLPAAKRYEKAVAQIEAMQVDIGIMKKVLEDHSVKLQKLA